MSEKNENIRRVFFANNFFCCLRSPFYIILSIVFPILFGVNFFIRQQFFTGSGSTDLLLFFSVAPYFCIFAVPLLCFPQTFSIYDDFVPLSSLEKSFIVFSARFCLFLIQLCLLLPAVFLLNIFGKIDLGQLFTSLACLAMYGSCVISLCCFLEKIFSSRIPFLAVSAIILAVFNTAHLFAVYLPLPNFLQAICRDFSFAWHFDAAGKGIFDTRDFLFFLGCTLLFIFLSDIENLRKKGFCFHKKAVFHSFMMIAFCVLVVLNGKRWYKRIDFSMNKTYSISGYSKKLLEKIDEPMKITYYCSSSLSKLYPQIRDVRDFLIDYSGENKNVSFLIQDPDKNEKTLALLQNYGVKTQQMRTISNTSAEIVNVYSAIVLEYRGNLQMIPFVLEANSLEYDLDIRIKSLLSGKQRFVNIVVANGLSLSEDYSYVVPWLSSQGFVCNPLYIEDPLFTSQIENCSGPLLVIGDGEMNIENAIAIENYILSGKGNALFNVSPYSVNIQEDWSVTENLRTNIVEMIENWGLSFPKKIAGDVSCARIMMMSDDESESKSMNYYLWPAILGQNNAPLGATVFWPVPLESEYFFETQDDANLQSDINSEKISSRNTSAKNDLKNNEQIVEKKSFFVKPYFISSPLSFSFDADGSSPESLVQTNPFLIEKTAFSDKEKKTQVFAAEISGKLDGLYNNLSYDGADVIVVSDQYFLNSLMTGYIGGESGDYRNFEVLTNMLLKLNGEYELSEIQSKISRDDSLFKVSDIQDFEQKRKIVFAVIFGILPLAVLVAGILLNIKFKKTLIKNIDKKIGQEKN